MTACLSENVLAALASGVVTGPSLDAAERHLDVCAHCRELLALALREDSREAPLVGRYRLLRKVGAGSMGRVYAAADPALGREIAIKLLRPSLSDDHAEGRERFLREARAMARLAHPNVITIHDVGTADAQWFIAMELVVGSTLAAWLSAAARDFREVASVMCAAGRGLAAAHAAGIVHRDFKPENVLVGADGRVQVTDFGLAHLAAGEPASRRDLGAAESDESSLVLTGGGTLLGTPAYMAPEQLRGELADERSDMFSFCVVFWEALYGERPFSGRNFDELCSAVLNGQTRARPTPRAVPDALHEAIRRGLESDRAARWQSMTALLGAVEAALSVARLAQSAAGIFGRGSELERIDAAVLRTQAGRGALLLLTGEAGIGKSRLAREAAARAARHGLRVAWGRCWELGGAPPYWPWLQVFRELGIDALPPRTLNPDGPSSERRFHFFDAVARALQAAARREPIAIVFEDLHATDVTSLLLLLFLTRQLWSCPVLIVGTARALEARTSPPIAEALAHLGREADTLSLSRLTREDLDLWLTQRGAVQSSAEIYRITEGNPLFVEELLRLGPAGSALHLSVGIKVIVDAHLDHLTPDTRPFLEVASVLGRRFDARELASVCGGDRGAVLDALERARELGVVERVAPELFQFSHVLLAERLHASLSTARRWELHWSAGLFFEASGAAPALIARHLLEGADAGSAEHAARAALRAAEQALGELAFESAVALAERALLLPGLPARLTAALEMVRGESLQRSGAIETGRACCLRAAELVRSLGAGAELARAALAYACEPTIAAIDPMMVQLLQEALAALAPDEVALAARVAARLSAALIPPKSEVQFEPIRRHALAALSAARRLGDAETLLYVLTNVRAGAAYMMSGDERFEITREMAELAQAQAQTLTVLRSGPDYVSALRERGQRAEADARLAALERDFATHAAPTMSWRLPMLKSALALLDGDIEATQRYSEEGLTFGERAHVPAARATWALQRVALAIAAPHEDSARITPNAEAVLATLAPNPTFAPWRAWILSALGRREEALLLVSQINRTPYLLQGLLIAAEVCTLLGERGAALDLYQRIDQWCSGAHFFWGGFCTGFVIGPVPRLLGGLAHLCDDAATARRHYQESVNYCRRIAAPLFLRLSETALERL